MARDIRVAFKLSDEKKAELEQYADSYGVTMSALCALIIGQWLHQQEKVHKPLVQAITNALEQEMKNMLANVDPEQMQGLLTKVEEQTRS